MSLWYTFKLSLKLGVLAKNGMRKNARVTSFAYLYNARHLLSDIFLKAKEGDTKKSGAATTILSAYFCISCCIYKSET